MNKLKKLLIASVVSITAFTAQAGELTIAAAADMKFAMADIVTAFKAEHPNDRVNVIFGSSGKTFTQIQQGAPYEIYFSADVKYPKELIKAGAAIPDVTPYAVGRIVLWSNKKDLQFASLSDLLSPSIKRIAIANPQHAPYGKRAEEALRAAGIWDKVQPKLVMGEDIVQTAQFVQSGNAEVGILALSLAMNPTMRQQGQYHLIAADQHEPLEQGFVITKKGENNPLAKQFADYMVSKSTRTIMTQYGFVLPSEKIAE